MKRVSVVFAVLALLLAGASAAKAEIWDYSFHGFVQAGSGYKMGSAYTTPLFNVGDNVDVTIRFNDTTGSVLSLDFTAGTYHHRMDDFTGYTVVSGPVFNYDAGTGRMNRADVRFNETQDNYPYWFIKYVYGGSSQDKWFAFNTYTNNDLVNGFSLNTFSYTESQRLAFTGAEAVPVPAALWVLASGFAGVAVLRRKLKG